MSLRKLLRARDGVATIEMAFALPVLIMMLWVMVQGAMVFRAMSGIQHGLGAGARYATLYPQPTTAAIAQKISDSVYGIGPGTFTVSSPVAGTASGANYLDLKVSYSQSTDLIMFPGPTINVTRSKRVWVAS